MGIIDSKEAKELRLSNQQKNEGVSKEIPSLKLDRQEIEFLLYLIQDGMIPGKD